MSNGPTCYPFEPWRDPEQEHDGIHGIHALAEAVEKAESVFDIAMNECGLDAEEAWSVTRGYLRHAVRTYRAARAASEGETGER